MLMANQVSMSWSAINFVHWGGPGDIFFTYVKIRRINSTYCNYKHITNQAVNLDFPTSDGLKF